MANSMTRQHFEAIAAAIATIEGGNLRIVACNKLVPVMREFNSFFNENRFRDACRAPLPNPIPPAARAGSHIRSMAFTEGIRFRAEDIFDQPAFMEALMREPQRPSGGGW